MPHLVGCVFESDLIRGGGGRGDTCVGKLAQHHRLRGAHGTTVRGADFALGSCECCKNSGHILKGAVFWKKRKGRKAEATSAGAIDKQTGSESSSEKKEGERLPGE